MADVSAHARLPVTDLSETQVAFRQQKLPEQSLREFLCSVSG